MTTLRAHPIAAGITAAFIILAMMYNFASPIFEVSDEVVHYPVIHHIKTTGDLPIQQPGIRSRFEQEGSQPPLYYLIATLITLPIDASDMAEVHWRNPHGKIGLSNHTDNKNMVIHTSAEDWPWQGTTLSVYVIRFFSIGLGAGSVALTYVLLREIWPEQRWFQLGGMSLVAFNPMFLFITASVNNDNLIVLIATWLLVICARTVKEGLTTRRIWLIAVLFALGSLTKTSGLTLAPIIGVVFIIHAVRHDDWVTPFRAGFIMIAVWLVLAGWWYARNLILYGELTGIKSHVAVVGGRTISAIDVIREEYYSYWVAYWAWFGGVNILAPDWVYRIYSVITFASLGGVAVWFVRKMGEWQRLVLPFLFGGYIIVIVLSVLNWTTITYASQGRLVFPAISVISGFCAVGMLHLIPERVRGVAFGGLAALLLGIAAWLPFSTIAPAYALPPTVEELPEDATPVGISWGPLELVGLRTTEPTVGTNMFLPITAYWRLNEATDANLSTYYNVLGRDFEEIGKVNAFPGGGALATSEMEVGTIIEDHYRILIDVDAEVPTLARVQIGVGQVEPGRFVYLRQNSQAANAPVSIQVVGGVVYPRILNDCAAVPVDGAPVTFFDFARLHLPDDVPSRVGYGQATSVTVVWEPYNLPEKDYTVFVHVINAAGEVVAQNDGPPLDGDYPTSYWRERCPFEATLTFPTDTLVRGGEYQLVVGLYDPATGERVIALDGEGTPYPDFAVPVGSIQLGGE